MKMKKSSLLLSFFVFLCCFSQAAWSQNSSTVDSLGYILKKQAPTSVQTGVPFNYVITYTVPPNSPSVIISDAVPAPLYIQSVNVTPGICGANAPNVVGRNVSLVIPATGNSSCSGSITISVMFPAGSTCNNHAVDNRATMTRNNLPFLSTIFVTTRAIATNPWTVSKVANANAISGIPTIGLDGLLTYTIMIAKPTTNIDTIGQINLNQYTLTDNFPPNAVLESVEVSDNGWAFTSIHPSSYVTTSSNSFIITNNNNPLLNVNVRSVYNGGALVAIGKTFRVRLRFPAAHFPVGSQFTNQVALQGGNSCSTGGNNSNTNNSASANAQIGNVAPNLNFSKSAFPQSVVAGCGMSYGLSLTNSGTATANGFSIIDTLPADFMLRRIYYSYRENSLVNNTGLVFSATLLPASGAQSVITPTINCNGQPDNTCLVDFTNMTFSTGDRVIISLTGNISFNPGAIAGMQVLGIVQNNVTSPFTNCAKGILNTASTTPLSHYACVTSQIMAASPKICLNKQVCNLRSSYQRGDIVRYRIRVQNTGSQSLSNVLVSDLLNNGLTYDANIANIVAYQIAPIDAVAPFECSNTLPTTATLINIAPPSVSGQQLNFTLPNVANSCEPNYNYSYNSQNCSSPIAPYYFIEFSVKINELAVSGALPNAATYTNVTSNTANIVIAPTYGYALTKEVSKDNGANYAKSVSMLTSSNPLAVKYKLTLQNIGSTVLKHAVLVDLLPQNNGTNDNLILQRNIVRNSNFSVLYNGNLTIQTDNGSGLQTQAATVSYSAIGNIKLPEPEINYLPLGASNPNWQASLTTSLVKGLKFEFDSNSLSLLPGGKIIITFDAIVPANTPANSVTRNTFAGNTRAFDGASVLQLLTRAESDTATIRIAAPDTCCPILSFSGDSCRRFVRINQGSPTCVSPIIKIEAIPFAGTTISSIVNSGGCTPSSSTATTLNYNPACQTFPTSVALSGATANANGYGYYTLRITLANGRICEQRDSFACPLVCPILSNRQNSCCALTACITPALGSLLSPITKIEYANVTGGTITSFNISGCTPTGTNPFIFNPACQANQICFTALGNATAPNYVIRFNLKITLQNGQICEYQDSIVCSKPVCNLRTQCDTIKVTNTLAPITWTARRFEIFNTKVTTSPISRVRIETGNWNAASATFTNLLSPFSSIVGNAATVNSANIPYGTPFQNLPNIGTFPAVTNAAHIQFNLRVKTNLLNPNLRTRITVFHCDGDSCTMFYDWKPVVVCPNCPKPNLTTATGITNRRLYFKNALNTHDSIKFVTVAITNDKEFFAISAGNNNTEDLLPTNQLRIANAFQAKQLAFFELENPIGLSSSDSSKFFNISVQDGAVFRITYFNTDGAEIGSDSLGVRTGTTGLQQLQGRINTYPNPTEGTVNVRLELPTTSDTRLELFNINGQLIKVLHNEKLVAGTHNMSFEMQYLTVGSYFIRVVSSDFTQAVPIKIVR